MVLDGMGWSHPDGRSVDVKAATHRHEIPRIGRLAGSLLAAVLLLAIGTATGYWLARRTEPPPVSTDMPSVPPRLAALGRLEPAAGIVFVHGPPGDRIVRLYPLVPGQEVEAGQPLAELASAEEQRRQVTIAELELQELEARRQALEEAGQAKLRASEAESQQLLAQQADDLAAQDARLEYLVQQVRLAEAALQRLERLRNEKVTVPAEEYDRARLTLAQAVAEHRAAEALRRKTHLSYQYAERLAHSRRLAAEAELREALSRLPLASARARLEAAREQWQRHAVIRAPIRGQILQVHAVTGQTIAQEPLLSMADLSRMAVRVEVYEGDLERLREAIKHGPVRAELRAPVLPRPIRAVLADDHAVARVIAPHRFLPPDPRAQRDSRTAEAILTIDDADTALAARFIGLQATVLFDLELHDDSHR